MKELISQLVARADLSEAQAAKVAEVVKDFLAAKLPDALRGPVETALTGQAVDGAFATVRSKVVTRRRTETPFDYRLHLRDGRWRVYDILIDHVSFVATYRSEFARIIQRESYAALVERLHKQNLDAAALVRMR